MDTCLMYRVNSHSLIMKMNVGCSIYSAWWYIRILYTQDYNACKYRIPSLSIYNIGNQSCKKIPNFKEATSDKLEKVGKGEESNAESYSKLWTRNACFHSLVWGLFLPYMGILQIGKST